MKNLKCMSSVAVAYDNDTGLINDSNLITSIGGLAVASVVLNAFKDIGKRKIEYKFYLGAKIRKKRYENRFLVYKKMLDVVILHSNIFTSSYNVFLYQKMEDSSHFLFFAMDDISTYENKYKLNKK